MDIILVLGGALLIGGAIIEVLNWLGLIHI